MGEDVGVPTPGFFEGVGQFGQAVKGTILVDSLRKLQDAANGPNRAEHYGPKGISTRALPETTSLGLGYR